jgi:hypothetical protein
MIETSKFMKVVLVVASRMSKSPFAAVKQSLALVEDAIRRRLLCTSPEADSRLNAVA